MLIALVVNVITVQVLLYVYFIAQDAILKISTLRVVQHDLSLLDNIFRQELAVAGFDGCQKHANINVVNETEIKFSYMLPHTTRLKASISAVNQLVVGHEVRFKKKERVRISDCIHSEVRTVADVRFHGGEQVLHLAEPLEYQYEQFAIVGQELNRHYRYNHARHKLLSVEHNKSYTMVNHLDVFAMSKTDAGQLKVNFVLNVNGYRQAGWLYAAA